MIKDLIIYAMIFMVGWTWGRAPAEIDRINAIAKEEFEKDLAKNWHAPLNYND